MPENGLRHSVVIHLLLHLYISQVRIRLVVVLVFLANCSTREKIVVVTESPDDFRPNSVFELYEDLSAPRFSLIRQHYRPDTVFRGGETEFKRQLLLRDWIRSRIQISDFESHYPGDDYPEKILASALQGQGYHCGHYMVVQNAVMNAYGYVTRCLGAGPGVAGGPDGHHGANEVWSNDFGKWYLSDAKYNHHFEKNGVPLSALELRDEYLRNKAADVVLVKGPERQVITFDLVADEAGKMREVTRERFAQTYTWIEWEKFNDRATGWPDAKAAQSVFIVYDDDFSRNNTWIWDGKPHWAYSKPEHMIRVSDRKAIEWIPNTIKSKVSLDGGMARITLESITPNFSTYQMREYPGGEWTDTGAEVQIDAMEKRVAFRVVNQSGVPGPEHLIRFEKQKR